MAAVATASSHGPRYAPEDPTLPKPWRGLVDGKTGYLYFWNPETNVTQYERPVASSSSDSAPPLKSSSMPVNSSVQGQQSSRGQYRDRSPNEQDGRYSRGSNGGSRPVVGERNQVIVIISFSATDLFSDVDHYLLEHNLYYLRCIIS